MNKPNIAFWGTPQLTTTILDALADSGYAPWLVITNPDRPQGRKMTLTPPPAKLWAEARDITVFQPEKVTPDVIAELAQTPWDIFVVVAYGSILPEGAINLPKHGTLNVHYSLLPKWRGATPVESAILNGDTETGVCIQQMVYKLDAGPIHKQESLVIGEHETALELRARLNTIGARLLIETLDEIFKGTAETSLQDETLATRCGKISKEDGLIDPTGDPIENDRKFRAYYGWPGVYFFIQKDDTKIRVKVTDAVLLDGKWIIKRVIPEGKNELDYDQFLKNIQL
jgi:methionyl-tRNA formyltransferase